MENLTSIIKSIYNEETPASYVGATLSFDVNGELKLLVLDPDNSDLSKEATYWLALCYIKYKSGSKTDLAYSIVNSYHDKQNTARELLKL